MARPTSIRNEQILDAARKCFLEHGYAVSTAVIARAAGVSEGSIFKRFATKERLFHASMGLPEFDLDEVVAGREDDPLEGLMIDVSLALIEFFRELIPRVLLLSATPQPGLHPVERFKKDPCSPPVKLLKSLTAFFDHQAHRGELETKEPEVVARMLLGSLHNFVFFEHLGVQSRLPVDDEAYARGVVATLWQGIRPSKAEVSH